MTILVTGAAGFIGFHLAQRLLQQGTAVVGLDCVDDYYDVSLKQARLRELEKLPGFRFVRMDIADKDDLDALFAATNFEVVVNLAAQAGVRYSLTNPQAYVRSNIQGFVNILEACRYRDVRHLVYASSSSVYGAVTKMPFSVHQNVDHPVSLYGASKKANELFAHSYSHLFGLPTTGLRFFTVYGPWGRPDMVLFIFTRAILANEPIRIFNHGHMERAFTYIDDITESVTRSLHRSPTSDPVLERRTSRSRHELSALSDLQYREQSAREVDVSRRNLGELPRPQGHQAFLADAARRRSGDLCRRRR